MKKNLILTVLIAITCALKAQFSPQVSHFMYDQLRTNPGSAGSTDMISVSGIIRQQMVGFDKSPKNLFFEIDAPFKLFGAHHGIGASILSDNLGFFENIDFQLSYAFRVSLGNGMLGIGLQAAFIQNKLEPDWLTVDGGNGATDDDIPQYSPSSPKFTFSGGLFYRTEDIYFGISSININDPEITEEDPTGIPAGYLVNRQYYVTAGYTMQLRNPAYEFKPAVLLKSDGVTTDMDINLCLEYNKSIWGGVTYRTGEAVVGMLGLSLTRLVPGLRVGFAYDYYTNALSNETYTYEILVNYSFKIGVEKAPQKYKSIRFL